MAIETQEPDWHQWEPFGFTQEEKRRKLAPLLAHLTAHHREKCPEYDRILSSRNGPSSDKDSIEAIPFLPVRLFKHLDLKSVPEQEVVRQLRSSGTTGQEPSKISLDKPTAAAQTRALVRILQEFLGTDRLPMLIVDHPSVVKQPGQFSARAAGILGLSNFGRNHTYALQDESLALDEDVVLNFIKNHRGKPKLIFGFTSILWKHFVQSAPCQKQRLDLRDSVLLHSGGWKQMEELAVGNMEFKQELLRLTGIERVHNFYGMAEQVGSIFVECEHGFLHAPAFADVVVRKSADWSISPDGEAGIVQVLSILPKSYPGHSLLTEDLGTIHHVDTCPCGRGGKAFLVQGRLQAAEARGCSDTQPVLPNEVSTSSAASTR